MDDIPLWKRLAWYGSETTIIILGLSVLQFGFLVQFTLTAGEEEFLALFGILFGFVSLSDKLYGRVRD
ncbi:hypothetical protein Z052_15415 [Halorubrum sp. C191]|uniref:hypothetical protein n=1 Tax=Halorubrum sp. C191 TaxID=1383842 RepID=UPI000C076BE4|nr:hypothetical protein [Halorubrum sp. C191]PHQ41261.1 hypothetical protein Z052_15415 [Halorubrum sp. C191]